MAGECGTSSGVSAAVSTVESQINQFTQKGDAAFAAAMSAINQIASTFNQKISETGVSIPGGTGPTTDDNLPDYVRPTPEPQDPELEWDAPVDLVNPPESETDYTDYFRGLDRPRFTERRPTLQFPSQPTTPLPDRPPSPDPLVMPEYPDAPDLTWPELQPLRPITLPELDPPNLDAINALILELRNRVPTAPEIPEDIDYLGLVNQLFNAAKGEVADILTGLVGRIAAMLNGGTGLPDEIAALLRNRAFAAEDRLAFQAEQEVVGDWLARGFTLPGGPLTTMLAAVRQKNRDKKAELNRDLYIEEAKQEIENLRFAVQQGIAYEGMWKDSLVKLYGVCGELASKAADVQLKLIDAAIELFKAKANLWQLEFSTIKDQIQIELAKVDIYKAELDGQRLIGELNKLDVDIYRLQMEAVMNRVNAYKIEVDAANARLQGELGKLQYATELVKIYTAEIGAWETEWKAYGEAVRGEQGKVELYKGLVQAFSAEVEAYAKDVDAAKAQASLELETLNSRLRTWEAKAEKYKAEIQAETARIGALANVYETQMKGYGLRHEAEKTYVDTEMGKLSYLLNVDRFEADVEIKNAELEQQKMLTLAKMAVDAMDAVARTSAQLAGSAMSAMNVGASISSSSSSSNSDSCSTSYTYEMSA